MPNRKVPDYISPSNHMVTIERDKPLPSPALERQKAAMSAEGRKQSERPVQKASNRGGRKRSAR